MCNIRTLATSIIFAISFVGSVFSQTIDNPGGGGGGGGSPGVSNLQVQYNNAGAFGGMTGTSWNDGAGVLTMPSAGAIVLGSSQIYTSYINSPLLLSAIDSGRLVLGGAQDTILGRNAAANFRFGSPDAAAPVAQTLSMQSVVAGTANTAGVDYTERLSLSTGSAIGGSYVMMGSPAGGAGSSQNTAERLFDVSPLRRAGIYQSYTDSSNYSRLEMGYSASYSGNYVMSNSAGTGAIQPLTIGVIGNNNLYFYVAGSNRLYIDYAGNLGFGLGASLANDNTKDFGNTVYGLNRPRDIYAGRDYYAGGGITTGAPSGGTAAKWKMGTVASVSPTSPNRTIEIEVNGTTYYVAAKTTNN